MSHAKLTAARVPEHAWWVVLGIVVASAMSGACGPEEVVIDGACFLPVETRPERATLLVDDSVLFASTYLRECDVAPPFSWRTVPAVLGVFAIQSDTSAWFKAHTAGMAVIVIDDVNSKQVGQAAVEVRATEAGAGERR